MTRKTPEQISYNMSRVKNKDSAIEIALRKELRSRGIRYRKNVTGVFGKPDIAFIGKKIAVFCDSEFWHGYDWENRKNEFKSNREFWISKIEKNIKRDNDVNLYLQKQGWTVLRFWGRDIIRDPAACADLIVKALKEKNPCSTKQ